MRSSRLLAMAGLLGCGQPAPAADASAVDAESMDAAYPVDWHQTFGEADYDWANGVAADAAGKVYVVGDLGATERYVAHFGPDGIQEWLLGLPRGAQDGWPYIDGPTAEIIEAGPSGVVVAPYRANAVYAFAPDGSPIDLAPPGCPILSVRPFGKLTTLCDDLVRSDFFGNVEWTVVPAEPVQAVAVSSAGELAVAAMTDHLYVARWSADGQPLWDRTFTSADLPTTACLARAALAAAPDRTYFVCPAVTLAFDADGELIWSRGIGTRHPAAADEQGNLLIAGFGGYGGAPHTAWVHKVDRDGQTLWQRNFAPVFSEFLAVNATSAGHVLAAGLQTTGNSADAMVVQLAP